LNQKVSGSGGMIWENLSRSFFSISSSYWSSKDYVIHFFSSSL
jgi:hypothetical protein